MAVNISKIFLVSVLVIFLNVYGIRRIYNHNFLTPGSTNKSINITLIFLLIISTITLVGVAFSYNIQPTTINIKPKFGGKGTRGDRGKGGKKASKLETCNDNTCYNKILKHITKVYNIYRKTKGLPRLSDSKFINNKFIKRKIKEMCNSDEFNLLLKNNGAHVLDRFDNPLDPEIEKNKCDINSNCGAYDYIFQKWTEWILTILKYKNGTEFLDSADLTDNDFDNMIDDIDNTKTKLNKKWIFDAEESFNTILYPKDTVNNKQIEYNFKNSYFYKFYNENGVPSSHNTDSKDKLLSPFDEIKKYDAWYWGSKPNSVPKIVDKCKYEPVFRDYPNNKKIKIKLSNDYIKMWTSKGARQIKIVDTLFDRTGNNNDNSGSLTFIPNQDKGAYNIDVYRAKELYDPDESDLKFKNYKPVGDVMVNSPLSENEIKTRRDCFPTLRGNSYTDKPRDLSKPVPKKLTLLVSGDTKPPVSFIQMYKSFREHGFDANNRGYIFWRPIAPTGYVALGDVIDISPNGKKPDVNIIACVPEACVEKEDINSSYEVWNTTDSNNKREIKTSSNTIITFKECTDTNKENSYNLIDSDCDVKGDKKMYSIINDDMPSTQNFDENLNKNMHLIISHLNAFNTFRVKTEKDEGEDKYEDKDEGEVEGESDFGDNSFYKIKHSCIYDSDPRNQTFKTTVIPRKKYSKKYSILKLFDK